MASKTGISKALRWLSEVTVGQEVTPALVVLWRAAFEGADDEALFQAAVAYAQNHRFFPAPADLLQYLDGETPSAGVAWVQVSEAIAGRVEFGELPEAARDAVRAIGGLKHMREQMTAQEARMAFVSIYKDLAAHQEIKRSRERARMLAPRLIAGLLEGPK